MDSIDRTKNTLALLKIRQKAYYRNLLITGGMALFTILATTGELILSEWNARSIYLMALFDFLFGVSFIMAWVRLEITKTAIDLVNNLLIRR